MGPVDFFGLPEEEVEGRGGVRGRGKERGRRRRRVPAPAYLLGSRSALLAGEPLGDAGDDLACGFSRGYSASWVLAVVGGRPQPWGGEWNLKEKCFKLVFGFWFWSLRRQLWSVEPGRTPAACPGALSSLFGGEALSLAVK